MDYESAFDLALSEAAHLPPDSGVLTVAQAHRAMRRHRGCQREKCGLKDLAAQTLSDAGEYTFASNYDGRR